MPPPSPPDKTAWVAQPSPNSDRDTAEEMRHVNTNSRGYTPDGKWLRKMSSWNVEDPVDQIMKEHDKDGDGMFDLNEVREICHTLLHHQKSHHMMRKVITLGFILWCVSMACVFGLAFFAVEKAKESHMHADAEESTSIHVGLDDEAVESGTIVSDALPNDVASSSVAVLTEVETVTLDINVGGLITESWFHIAGGYKPYSDRVVLHTMSGCGDQIVLTANDDMEATGTVTIDGTVFDIVTSAGITHENVSVTVGNTTIDAIVDVDIVSDDDDDDDGGSNKAVKRKLDSELIDEVSRDCKEKELDVGELSELVILKKHTVMHDPLPKRNDDKDDKDEVNKGEVEAEYRIKRDYAPVKIRRDEVRPKKIRKAKLQCCLKCMKEDPLESNEAVFERLRTEPEEQRSPPLKLTLEVGREKTAVPKSKFKNSVCPKEGKVDRTLGKKCTAKDVLVAKKNLVNRETAKDTLKKEKEVVKKALENASPKEKAEYEENRIDLEERNAAEEELKRH